MSSKSNNSIYQLKVTLHHSKPPIWRRLLVLDSIPLDRLHTIIQVAMGWTNSHLHQFIIEGSYYSIPSPDDWEPMIDERRYSLNQIAPFEKYKFTYEYDFGDSWEHEIVVEKILPFDPNVKYPICIKGKRACPPEDIGGVWGYDEFLEIMKDPAHDEYDSYIEWLGDGFDPEEFDIEEINQVLQRIK
ncbi:MAG: plasmid pRiA4b ORF-3 family protein [Anaerolineales bacterium]|nr:plasmid pRiA4b ORF-3 family protein [Anaerolineales bacterium]